MDFTVTAKPSRMMTPLPQSATMDMVALPCRMGVSTTPEWLPPTVTTASLSDSAVTLRAVVNVSGKGTNTPSPGDVNTISAMSCCASGFILTPIESISSVEYSTAVLSDMV